MVRLSSFFFSTRSPVSFVIRVALITVVIGLMAYKVGLFPLNDLWTLKRNRLVHVTANSLKPLQTEWNTPTVTPDTPSLREFNLNVSKTACIFPKLDLNDPAIMKFFVKHPRVECPVEADWLVIKNGMFIITDSAHRKHTNIRCDAYPIVKVTDFNVRELEPIKDVVNGTMITNDFYRVKCVSSDGGSFKSYLAGIRHDKEIHNRPVTNLSAGLDLDVVMLGLDSTSRLAWHRHLPKSRNYFVNVLHGTEMEGYTILGDGTPAAIMPILIGKREEELHEARRNHPGATEVDDFPWIWHEFRSAGYALAWAEDDALLGTFQYRLLGFKNQPTDHYYRYFCVAAEPNYGSFSPDCMGSKPRHSVVLDYVNDVFGMYPKRRKWIFSFQSQLSHKDNNLLSKMDDDLLAHLERMHLQGSLDQAIFIMMADHGGRFSKVRATAQGKLEERLPYFGVRFPKWFHEKHPDIINNIKTNSKRLITPFDIHETFHEILKYTGAGKADIKNRGVSIFKEIPVERDCEAAHVDPHWCACLEWQQVDPKNATLNLAVSAVLDTFNNYTSAYRDLCSLLSISKVVSATSLKVNDAVLKFKDTNDGGRGRFGLMTDTTKHSKVLYQITLFTHPGESRFEVTVTHHLLTNTFTLDKKDISRTNVYGTQPWCVEKEESFLRPYCYCKKPQAP